MIMIIAIITIIIIMIKIILITVVILIVNSPFQPGDFSTGSTTEHILLNMNYAETDNSR